MDKLCMNNSREKSYKVMVLYSINNLKEYMGKEIIKISEHNLDAPSSRKDKWRKMFIRRSYISLKLKEKLFKVLETVDDSAPRMLHP